MSPDDLIVVNCKGCRATLLAPRMKKVPLRPLKRLCVGIFGYVPSFVAARRNGFSYCNECDVQRMPVGGSNTFKPR